MDIIDNHIKLMRMMIFTYGNTTSNSDTSNYYHECIIAKTKMAIPMALVTVIMVVVVIIKLPSPTTAVS